MFHVPHHDHHIKSFQRSYENKLRIILLSGVLVALSFAFLSLPIFGLQIIGGDSVNVSWDIFKTIISLKQRHVSQRHQWCQKRSSFIFAFHAVAAEGPFRVQRITFILLLLSYCKSYWMIMMMILFLVDIQLQSFSLCNFLEEIKQRKERKGEKIHRGWETKWTTHSGSFEGWKLDFL